jgi:hypothetical protein
MALGAELGVQEDNTNTIDTRVMATRIVTMGGLTSATENLI